MFDFIRKPLLFDAWAAGFSKEMELTQSYSLKTAQDLAVYSYLRESAGKTIAEIGGGNSRILGALAKRNQCCNVEKFEGGDGGPDQEVVIDGVRNVKAFLGDFSGDLPEAHFDVVFSISVVEHVPDGKLDDFVRDGIRILKPGGLWLHAIDLYLEDEPGNYVRSRFQRYREWLQIPGLHPAGTITEQGPHFSCDLVTNPDNIMHAWGRVAPALDPLRRRAQCVSLLVAGLRT